MTVKDEYTHLKLSRQQKWKLRHPTKAKAINAAYEASPARRQAKRQWYLKNKEVTNEIRTIP